MNITTTPSYTDDPLTGFLSSQIALLNYFFPGYSLFRSTVNTSLGSIFEKSSPCMLLIFGAAILWNYCRGTIYAFIECHFMSSFTVRTDDEVYDILMLWTTQQTFAQETRKFVVNTNIYSRTAYMWRQDETNEMDGDDGGTMEHKYILRYTPSMGCHWFWFKGRLLCYHRQDTQSQQAARSANEREVISVSCFGRDPSILKQLLREARSIYMKNDELKTVIYRATSNNVDQGGDCYWKRCTARPNRPWSTVILPDGVKERLVADAIDYLNVSTRRWYANRGIPYRRGYLFYGPPGTGKSSLSLALAGHLRMKIYILSLSSTTATEENVGRLFNDLPSSCIVLLEDIDTAGVTHTRDGQNPSKLDGCNTDRDSAERAPSGQLSMSGLLNILDGVAAQEGRLLIMTTNHLEKLDKALVRPGRVDKIIPFELADRETARSIFCAIFTPYPDDISSNLPLEHENMVSVNSEKTRSCQSEEIENPVAAMAARFAMQVPEKVFSAAEIQGLLLQHKNNPQSALDSVQDWLKRMDRDESKKELEFRSDSAWSDASPLSSSPPCISI